LLIFCECVYECFADCAVWGIWLLLPVINSGFLQLVFFFFFNGQNISYILQEFHSKWRLWVVMVCIFYCIDFCHTRPGIAHVICSQYAFLPHTFPRSSCKIDQMFCTYSIFSVMWFEANVKWFWWELHVTKLFIYTQQTKLVLSLSDRWQFIQQWKKFWHSILKSVLFISDKWQFIQQRKHPKTLTLDFFQSNIKIQMYKICRLH
jgi:hypothetical protein